MEHFRASSLFQPTNFVAAIESHKDGRQDDRPKHLFGALMMIPSTVIARATAVLGFEFVFVDAQHAPTNAENLVDIIHTINFASEGKTCAIVRVPGVESDLLPYALDAGAAGIVFPQIETAAEARAAVQKVRYAYGGGNRSISPIALLDGITNIAPPGWTSETIADRNVAVICQIESMLAVENSHEIATTPGVNALMLGPGDLRVSLGLPCRNPPGQGEHPKFLAAVAKMVAGAKSCGIPLMAPAFRMDPEKTAWMQDFKLLLTGVDLLSMVKAYRQDLTKMKEAVLRNENKSGKSNGIKHDEPNGTDSDQNGAYILNGGVPNGLSGTNSGESGAIKGAHRLAITHGNVNYLLRTSHASLDGWAS